MQLSFIQRLPPHMEDPRKPRTQKGERESFLVPKSAPTTKPSPAGPSSDNLVERLFSRDGRVNLPASVQIDPLGGEIAGTPPGLPSARDKSLAKQLLERPNPIDYRQTRFDKHWASDGTLGDRIVEQLNEGMAGMAKGLAGKQDQPARARPPPEVRFNPGLHERPSDVGSEATGDAYKAAPIPFEKAPGLNGDASRRLRDEIAALKKQYAKCSAGIFRQLLAPVNAHLSDLERVEYAYSHGADPVQAEHLLPRSADMAFDQARRALWYAARRLAACTE